MCPYVAETCFLEILIYSVIRYAIENSNLRNCLLKYLFCFSAVEIIVQ